VLDGEANGLEFLGQQVPAFAGEDGAEDLEFAAQRHQCIHDSPDLTDCRGIFPTPRPLRDGGSLGTSPCRVVSFWRDRGRGGRCQIGELEAVVVQLLWRWRSFVHPGGSAQLELSDTMLD
jgi:hypothetical protein